MSLWQYYATQDGFVSFHKADDSASEAKPPSNEEFDEVVKRFV